MRLSAKRGDKAAAVVEHDGTSDSGSIACLPITRYQHLAAFEPDCFSYINGFRAVTGGCDRKRPG